MSEVKKEMDDQIAKRKEERRELRLLDREIKNLEKEEHNLLRDISIQSFFPAATEEEMRENLTKRQEDIKKKTDQDQKKKDLGKLGKVIYSRQTELEKLNKATRKIKSQQLGVDKDDRQYWTFQGDRSRIFVRFRNPPEERWGFYNSELSFSNLIKSLSELGMREKCLNKKLKKMQTELQLKQSETAPIIVKKNEDCSLRINPPSLSQEEEISKENSSSTDHGHGCSSSVEELSPLSMALQKALHYGTPYNKRKHLPIQSKYTLRTSTRYGQYTNTNQRVNTNLSPQIADPINLFQKILLMEDNYTNFFIQRNLQWDSDQQRDQWRAFGVRIFSDMNQHASSSPNSPQTVEDPDDIFKEEEKDSQFQDKSIEDIFNEEIFQNQKTNQQKPMDQQGDLNHSKKMHKGQEMFGNIKSGLKIVEEDDIFLKQEKKAIEMRDWMKVFFRKCLNPYVIISATFMNKIIQKDDSEQFTESDLSDNENQSKEDSKESSTSAGNETQTDFAQSKIPESKKPETQRMSLKCRKIEPIFVNII